MGDNKTTVVIESSEVQNIVMEIVGSPTGNIIARLLDILDDLNYVDHLESVERLVLKDRMDIDESALGGELSHIIKTHLRDVFGMFGIIIDDEVNITLEDATNIIEAIRKIDDMGQYDAVFISSLIADIHDEEDLLVAILNYFDPSISKVFLASYIKDISPKLIFFITTKAKDNLDDGPMEHDADQEDLGEMAVAIINLAQELNNMPPPPNITSVLIDKSFKYFLVNNTEDLISSAAKKLSIYSGELEPDEYARYAYVTAMEFLVLYYLKDKEEYLGNTLLKLDDVEKPTEVFKTVKSIDERYKEIGFYEYLDNIKKKGDTDGQTT